MFDFSTRISSIHEYNVQLTSDTNNIDVNTFFNKHILKIVKSGENFYPNTHYWLLHSNHVKSWHVILLTYQTNLSKPHTICN